jgi:hypothetical protein
MAVTVLWLVLAAFAAGWEMVCRRFGSRWTSLSELGSRAWASMPGRLLLVTGWAFIGWHVFARYTLPR